MSQSQHTVLSFECNNTAIVLRTTRAPIRVLMQHTCWNALSSCRVLCRSLFWLRSSTTSRTPVALITRKNSPASCKSSQHYRWKHCQKVQMLSVLAAVCYWSNFELQLAAQALCYCVRTLQELSPGQARTHLGPTRTAHREKHQLLVVPL
jgi:hypothetical protein